MTQIQKAIAMLNDRGRYQIILTCFLLLLYMELAFLLIGSSFMLMNPSFDCQGKLDLTEEQACRIIDKCNVVNDFTIVAHTRLYCSKEKQRNMVQSAVYIGSIIGLLVVTPFAEEKGKKKLFVLSQGIQVLGLAFLGGGALAKVTAMMVIGQVLIGIGCYTIMILGYVLVSQFCQDRMKQYVIVLLNAIWGVAQIIIAGLYFWLPQWQYYLFCFITAPCVALLVFGYFFLVESPYYLLGKKQDLEQAMRIMRKIARINSQPEDKLVQIEAEFKAVLQKADNHTQSEQVIKTSRFSIFQDRQYMKVLLSVAVLQIAVNAYYYGVQYTIGKLGSNFGYNVLLTGCIQTVSLFSSNLWITKMPRKTGMLIFNLLNAGMGFLFFIPFGKVMQTVLVGACRFFNGYAMAIVPQIQNQPFPHKYRSVAWGYIEGISQLGNVITPFIVTACEDGNVNPLIVLSSMLALLGTLPLLLFRETLGVSEDEIEAEAEKGDSQSDSQIEGSLLKPD